MKAHSVSMSNRIVAAAGASASVTSVPGRPSWAKGQRGQTLQQFYGVERQMRCPVGPAAAQLQQSRIGGLPSQHKDPFSASARTSQGHKAQQRSDPMPKIERQLDAAAEAREAATRAHCTEVFERMARASNGRVTAS